MLLIYCLFYLQWTRWRLSVWLEVVQASPVTWRLHFHQMSRIWYCFIKMFMEHQFTGKELSLYHLCLFTDIDLKDAIILRPKYFFTFLQNYKVSNSQRFD